MNEADETTRELPNAHLQTGGSLLMMKPMNYSRPVQIHLSTAAQSEVSERTGASDVAWFR
jgi:hypothetical protein